MSLYYYWFFFKVVHNEILPVLIAETNQELIMSQGGIGLLARTADDAEDPQTLRMVAGAIANLCGNGASAFHFLSKTAAPFLAAAVVGSQTHPRLSCESWLLGLALTGS